jgi:hypothetical protein
MPQRPARSCALPALVCFLALLAGADDFNLARVVLPLPGPGSEAPLPLDDPNTDFTEAPQAQEQTAAGPGPCAAPGAAVRGPARTAVAPPARGPSARSPIASPLRC